MSQHCMIVIPNGWQAETFPIIGAAMTEIEHFQNGIALIRDAIKIPKEITDELLVISKAQW